MHLRYLDASKVRLGLALLYVFYALKKSASSFYLSVKQELLTLSGLYQSVLW